MKKYVFRKYEAIVNPEKNPDMFLCYSEPMKESGHEFMGSHIALKEL